MKKALIVTVYNSENCGSFLQAFALKQVLTNLGFEVAFYKRDTKETSHQFSSRVIPAIKSIFKFQLKNAFFLIGCWFRYESAQKIFKICDSQSDFIDKADIIIIGSDTLWNFDTPYFKKRFDIYGGKIFKGKNIITYAISAANTSPETFQQVLLEYNNNIKNISSVLVRDKYTQELIKQYSSNAIKIVCDPTLLLTPIDYKILSTKKHITKPFLLLYYFNSFTQSQQESIIQYAKEKKLEIISLLSYRKWCNKSIMPSPQNLIFYFSHATCVITDTFHGTAFSLIYEKRFAVFDEGKNKVKELLLTYNKQDHLFKHYENLPLILNKTNDVVLSGKYDEIRNQSIYNLVQSIKSIKNGNN